MTGLAQRARWNRAAIVAAMLKADLTQARLAERIGVSLGTINRSLTDIRQPTLAESVAIAGVLGLALEDVTDRAGGAPRLKIPGRSRGRPPGQITGAPLRSNGSAAGAGVAVALGWAGVHQNTKARV